MTTNAAMNEGGSLPAPLPLWTNPMRFFLWAFYLVVGVAVSFVFPVAPWLRLTVASGAWVGVVAILVFMILYSRVDLHISPSSTGGHLLNWLVFMPATIAIPIVFDGRAFDGFFGTFTFGITWLCMLGALPKLFAAVSLQESSTYGRVGSSLGYALKFSLLYTGWAAAIPVLCEYVLPFILDD